MGFELSPCVSLASNFQTRECGKRVNYILSATGSHEQGGDVCRVCGDILVYGWTQRLFDSAAGTLARTLAKVHSRMAECVGTVVSR